MRATKEDMKARWGAFEHLLTRTRTQEVFKGLPLSDLSPSHRGTIWENLAREWTRRSNHTVSTSIQTIGLTGKKRPARCEEYDFLRDGVTRVEVKSAQLTWDMTNCRWGFVFLAIKTEKHDETQMVMYAPTGIYIWRNVALKLQSPGPVRMDYGRNFRIYASKGEESPTDAMTQIVSKMSADAELLVHIEW